MNSMRIKVVCSALLEQRPLRAEAGEVMSKRVSKARAYNRWHELCCDIADACEEAQGTKNFDRIEFFANCQGLTKGEFAILYPKDKNA